MSTIQNPTRKPTTYLDKFDEMVENIEKASALAEVACSSKINELSEATVFRYFSTLSDILYRVRTLSSEVQKSNKI